MNVKPSTSKHFRSACVACGRSIIPGDRYWFDPSTRKACCDACGQQRYGNGQAAPATPAASPAKLSPAQKAAATRAARRAGRAYVSPTSALPTSVPGSVVTPTTRVYRLERGSIVEAVHAAIADVGANEAARVNVNRKQDRVWGEAWVNYRTRESFVEQLETVDPVTLARVEKAVEALQGELARSDSLATAPRRHVRRGCEFGDEVDVDRFLRRDLNCWERNERTSLPRRVAKLGVNLTTPGGYDSDQAAWRGAAIVAIADILTRRGWSVEITAVVCRRPDHPAIDLSLERYAIKSADQPFDLGGAAFALSDVSFARIASVTGAWRYFPATEDPEVNATPMRLPDEERKAFDVFVEFDADSLDSAKRWVVDSLRKFDPETVAA